MSSSKQFHAALHDWAEVFMKHSMHAWMSYVKSQKLSMPQFNVLMRLYYHGSCGVSEVSHHLEVTPAGASQLVDGLVQLGLLERVEAEHDRRAKQITLSGKGRALIERGIAKRSEWMEGLTQHLNAERRDAIVGALKHLTEAVHQLEVEAEGQ